LLSLLSLDQGPDINDKFIHFSAYGFIAFIGLLASKKNAKSLLIVMLIVFGVIIECLQGFSGLRNFEYMDIIANSFGVLGGYIIFLFMKKTLKKAL
jgi:VanZ family protein